MTGLTTSRTEHHINCGTPEWVVSGPVSEFALQLIAVHNLDGVVIIPADEIDLLIDALTTIRDHMKESAT